MTSYKFKKPAERPQFGPLEKGDYNYVVSEIIDEPHLKSETGNMVMKAKLSIQPEGIPVFVNLWARTENSLTQDGRDGIAEFLLSCNRAPKEGDDPNWGEVVGARGRCRLKVEIQKMGAWAGKEVNQVAWFHAPKQVGPQASKQSVSKNEFKKARQEQVEASGGGSPEADEDSIPY